MSSNLDFNTNHKILFPFQGLSLRVSTSDNKSKMSDFLLHLNKAYKIPSTVLTIRLYLLSRITRLVYLTNICHSWILATSWERCTYINTGHLSAFHRLSINVTQWKGIIYISKYRLSLPVG